MRSSPFLLVFFVKSSSLSTSFWCWLLTRANTMICASYDTTEAPPSKSLISFKAWSMSFVWINQYLWKIKENIHGKNDVRHYKNAKKTAKMLQMFQTLKYQFLPCKVSCAEGSHISYNRERSTLSNVFPYTIRSNRVWWRFCVLW